MARVGTRGAGLSKDIALSVKNKLTHLGANVSDDLARLSGKVEDAFAYADGAVSKNIGKHNARVYQSNGGNWAKALKAGEDVSINVKVNYVGDSLRPDSFEVGYSIDGDYTKQFIKNMR